MMATAAALAELVADRIWAAASSSPARVRERPAAARSSAA